MATGWVRKQINFNSLVYLAIAIVLLFYSCQNKNKPVHSKTQRLTKTRPKAIPLTVKEDDFESRADSISLFDLDLREAVKGDSVGFVSVSDIYPLPGNLDSPDDSVTRLVIPDLTNKKPEETRYFALTSKYRKILLAATDISEADSLFIYDYSNDTLLSFSIRSLDAVASLSVYEDATKAKHEARDYQIGFKINKALLAGLSSKYFSKTFVYIGALDPFDRGKMHPVIWEKIDPKKVPDIKLKTEDTVALKGYKFSDAYNFESDGFHYYLQMYLNSESSSVSYRMLIMNADNEIISNYLDYETESSSPAPISILNNKENILEQWTGHLLKNRPPVLVGFDYIDFGCDILSFVDKSNKYVRLNCDNRH